MNRRLGFCLRSALFAGSIIWAGKAAAPQIVQAAGCAPVASPSANIAPSAGFSTPAAVVASFDHARQAEGCTVALSINQSTFGGLSPQQQMLALFNAERSDRGLGTLQFDPSLLSQIDVNHSREMAQYGYFNHPSPINQPGSVFNRLTVNPAINGHWTGLAENIAAGYSAPAAVYAYMYQDSGESWGHRHNILGYTGSTFGAYRWVGVGYATGGTYGTYFTSDFMASTSYSPPGLDSTPPALSQPVVTSGNLSSGGTVAVRVTGVSDSGAQSGEAGVTGVVFYANSPVTSSGTYTTVSATQSTAGTWSATLTNVPANATLHAVAVDGSGNYTDCAVGSSTCSAGTGGGSGGGSGGTPGVTLNVSSATPGASFTASGTGFAADETVNLYWNTTASTPIGAVTVSTSGTFSRSIAVPSNASAGTAQVIAVGQTARDSAHASLQVTVPVQAGTSISLQPASGVRSSTVSLTGTGYQNGEYILLRWNCASATCTGYMSLGAVRATTAGTFSIAMRIPYTTLGTHAIGVLGYTSHHFATATFAITG